MATVGFYGKSAHCGFEPPPADVAEGGWTLDHGAKLWRTDQRHESPVAKERRGLDWLGRR